MQQTWNTFNEKAQSGSFTMEKESAAKAAAACEQLALDLQKEINTRKQLGALKSFGTFASAEQARGHYEAQYLAWSAEVKKCIDIAIVMQLAFQKAGHLTNDQEDENKSHIQQNKPGG